MKSKHLPLCLAALLCAAHGVADGLDPKLLSEWPRSPVGWVGDAVVRSNYAYAIASSGAGCHVLDISDPASPRQVGATGPTLNGSAKFIGNFAYVATGNSGLVVLDMSNPLNPKRVGGFDTAGSASDVAVAGNYAYLVETLSISNGLLHAIDISDPKHPVAVGTHPINARALNVEVSGDHALVLGWPFLWDQGDQWTLDCFDIGTPSQPKRAGQIQRAGYLADSPSYGRMVVSGDYAYISALHYDLNYASVEVVDLRDPANPQWVAAFKANSRTGSLAVSGDKLYLAKTSLDGRSGLDILDISNPATIRRLAFYPGEVNGVAVVGTQAVLANNGRVEFLDVSTPSSPQRISSWMPPSGAMDVAHKGNLAYLVGPIGLTTYLNILDTSDPAKPQPVGGLSVNGWTQRIKLLGNYAYIVTEQGLHVVDVTDPKAPRKTGAVAPQQAFRDIAFSGDYAFLADLEAGVQLLTITNAASPRRLATLLAGSAEPVYGVCTSSDLAFVWTRIYPQGPPYEWSGTVNILDISNPRNAVTLSSYLTTGMLVRAVAAGNHLYLAKRYKQDADRGWWGGMLEILDVSDPSNPYMISQYETSGEPEDLSVTGGRAYVVCRGGSGGPWQDGQHNADGGLNIIDVSDPSHPHRVGGFQRTSLSAVRVDGDRAYVGGGTLQILDLNPTAALSRTAVLDTTDLACGVAMSGDRLLVANRLGGVQVVDATDPANLKWQATIASTDPVLGVALSGSTAYVASDASGVRAFDLADPTNPQFLGVYDTPGLARGMALSGTHAYVADGSGGLQILDVSNPANMERVGNVATTGFANSVALMGKYALVADWENGLAIVDVATPQTAHIVGNYNTGGYTLAVAVAGSNAILSDGAGGFQVVDLSKPAEPRLLGRAPADGWARHIAVSGRFAYVADAFSGVQVYDISDVSHPRRMGGTSAVDPYSILTTANHLFAAGGRDGVAVLAPFIPPLDVTASPVQDRGSINLRVDGPPGASVRIQRSPDMVKWQDWQTLTVGETPSIVSDTIPTGASQGFYRAVSP